jgi:hypothetical protein
MLNYRLLTLASAALLSLAGCSKNSAGEDNAGAAKLEVRLTDAPGNFKAVVLDVQQLEVHLQDENDPSGWQTLAFTPQAVNVLDYVNGDLKEVRLTLGPNSYVVGTDGNTYALKTPSGQTSGVKLKLTNVTLAAGSTYQLLLDFDVAKSIVERGNWKAGNDKKERYLLKPVIRLVAQRLQGGLRGTVTPAVARPQVLAIRSAITGPDTVSTFADTSGAFQLNGLPAGTYQVQYFPTATAPAGQPAYKNVVLNGITVTNDKVTEIVGATALN